MWAAGGCILRDENGDPISLRSRTRVAGVLPWLAVGVVAAQTPPSLQGPTPTFRSQVEYVEVDAVVTDRRGELVRDLTKDVFRVFEDGRPQTISSFEIVDIPIDTPPAATLASPRAIDADTQSNERPIGRLYVLVVDVLHVHFDQTPRLWAAARQFIERNLGAHDWMAVISTGGRSEDAQDFTSDKRLLLGSVDRFVGDGRDASAAARDEELDRVRRAEILLQTLRRTAEWLGGVHGRRKTILLFSEGIDFDMTSPGAGEAAVMAEFPNTVAAIDRANVSIYAIDPRGLTVAGNTIELGALEGRGVWLNKPPGQAGRASGQLASPMGALDQVREQLRLSQRSLRFLSDDTGGFAALNSNDYTGAFERIVRDNSSYYVLAYSSPSPNRDNTFRRVEVKVTRPDVTVRARNGYALLKGGPGRAGARSQGVASARGLPAQLRDALTSPLPVSGLALRVSATPFRSTDRNVSVLVVTELAGRDLTLDRGGRVEISMLAVDTRSKVHGVRNEVLSLNLRPETRTQVERSGVRLLKRMELPAGRYQLRVAARDTRNNRVGAVIHDLDVPDFQPGRVSMSGLVLTSATPDTMMTPQSDDELANVLPSPPTAIRTFPQNDTLFVYTEVYNQPAGAVGAFEITVTVLTSDGRTLFKAAETLDASALQQAGDRFGYSARVPLAAIPPGTYLLSVEGQSNGGPNASAARHVRFSVTSGT